MGDGGQAIAALPVEDPVQSRRTTNRHAGDVMCFIVPELRQWGGGVAIIIAIWVRRANSGDQYAIEREGLARCTSNWIWRDASANLPVGVDIVEPGEGGALRFNEKRVVGTADELKCSPHLQVINLS